MTGGFRTLPCLVLLRLSSKPLRPGGEWKPPGRATEWVAEGRPTEWKPPGRPTEWKPDAMSDR